MRIPEQKIEEIRAAANIVDVISETIQLRRRGRNYLGLCPFHNEKTPSFTVSEDKQIFHCFGCHAGGNIFKYLMDYEKISFVEAVKEVAQRVGIEIEYDEDTSGRQSEQEILYDINSLAGRYFSDNLINSPEGEIGRKYFENRRIKVKTIREFGLGYAFADRGSFVEYARKNKIDLEKALELGLVGQNKDGRLYDKFAGRIIFPIFSPNGRVVAFAGRILEKNAAAAKYLNSPESSVYYKGKLLYGLSFAKDEIRRKNAALIVEGYMDLISLYQAGVKNVVAVSGTALTDDQVLLLSRYTKNVILLFDADNAGIKASMRSIEILLKRDMEIKIVSLPQGEDPDSFVNTYGRERFEEEMNRAVNFLEYQTKVYKSQGMFDAPDTMTEAIRDLVKPVALIGDELKRILLLRSIAEKFNLREKLLENELIEFMKRDTRPKSETARQIEEKKEEIKQHETASAEKRKSTNPALVILEKDLIKLLFEGIEDITGFIYSHIPPESFSVKGHEEMASIVYSAYANHEDISSSYLIEKLPEEKYKEYVRKLILNRNTISDKWEKFTPGGLSGEVLMKHAFDSVKKFRITVIETRISELLKNMETEPDETAKFEIMKHIRDLRQEISTISSEMTSKSK